jgi:glycosyltransferase involved in cell wall biosynthesis
VTLRAERGLGRPGQLSVAVIAWTANPGRSTDVARVLGGDARVFFDLGIVNRRYVPIRYALSAARTVAFLAVRRPRSVVAINPPVVPGLIAWAYGRLTGAPVVLDSHPSAFDPNAHAELARQIPLHRWLTKRVAATIVASPELGHVVHVWGGTPIVFHEAAGPWRVAPPRPLSGRPRVLSIGTFAPDEPTAAVIEAARMLPDCDFTLTGDPRRCQPDVRARAPRNVDFPGFLRGERYSAALEDADVIVSLTSRPQSVSRASYEAVYALRPLVSSDWPITRELFPEAVHVANDAASIADGVREAVTRHDELVDRAQAALQRQQARVDEQLAQVRRALHLPPAGHPPPPSSTPSLVGSRA